MSSKSHRCLLLAIVAGGFTFVSHAALASPPEMKCPPDFASLAKGKEMLDRDTISKSMEKQCGKLEGLKAHWDDADIDHDGKINKKEYEDYVSASHD